MGLFNMFSDEGWQADPSKGMLGLLSPSDRFMAAMQAISQMGAQMAQPGQSKGQALASGAAGLGQGLQSGMQGALMQRMLGSKLEDQQRQRTAQDRLGMALRTGGASGADMLRAGGPQAGGQAVNPADILDAYPSAAPAVLASMLPQKPKTPELGATRKFGQGDQEITQEWDGQKWVQLGAGPRWEQAWRDPNYVAAQKDIRAAGKPDVNVQVQTNSQNALYKGMTEGFVKEINDLRSKADSAVSQLQVADTARNLLDSGVITGTGANFRTALHRALATAGVVNPEKVANTEAFVSTMGRQTLDLVKQLGAGSGISNADRDYAEKVAGGNIEMSEQGIRRLLDINDRAARTLIDSYNSKAAPLAQDPNVPAFMRGNLVIKAPESRKPKPSGGMRFLGFE